MVGHEIDIETADGPMAAYVAEPAQPDGRAVLVLMEAFGVNDHIRSVCDRFAAAGMVALAPDLYHRRGRMLTGRYDAMGDVMAHFAHLTTDGLATDVSAGLAELRSRGDVRRESVGVIGFCLGGYTAVLAALRSDPAAVAGFYGAGLAIGREGSPLDQIADEADQIRCPVLLCYGADDPVIPPAEIDAVRQALDGAGVDHEIVVYPGAGHGFFCDARAAYVAESAADAWAKVTRLFDRAMQPGPG
jgi:carboxymethylenebutenolidase